MLAEARFVSSKMQGKGEDEVDHLVIYLQNLDVNRAMDRNSPTDEKGVSVQVYSHRPVCRRQIASVVIGVRSLFQYFTFSARGSSIFILSRSWLCRGS